MVIQNRDVTVAERAMRFESGARFLELPKVIASRLQSLRYRVQSQSSRPDAERRREVAAQDREIVEHEVLKPVAAGDLADEQEIPLAEPVREFANRAAEVPGFLERHVLHSVD